MCPAAMLARAGLLLYLVVESRQLSITELVVPNTLRSGESAELACRVDRGTAPEEALIVKWWWKPVNSSADKIQIYQRIGTNPGTAILHDIQSKENDTIVVLEAAPADSGTYECEVSYDIEEVRRHEDLTVFTPGTGPQLNISKVPDGPDEDDEEDVLIECRADDVAPAPDVVLKINGEEFNMTDEVIGPDGDGFYDAMVTATLSADAVRGTEVTCELFYADARISHEPYTDTQVYVSGALTTTEPPEESTELVVAPDPLQNQSGDSAVSRASWALLLAFSLLAQAPSLLGLFNVILM